MSNHIEQNSKAHALRKEGNYNDAIAIYQPIWDERKDKFAGAGLVNCFRKTGNSEMALKIATDLLPIVEKDKSFDWGIWEVTWAIMNGKFDKLREDASLEEIIENGKEIIRLNQQDIALKKVVFRIIKKAIVLKKWDVVDNWADKLNPEQLDTTPMVIKGRDGWCDQIRWYNFKVKALINLGKSEEAFTLIEGAIIKFPRQKKFLLRLEAMAFHKLGELEKAEGCYSALCKVHRPDWWILHEFAKVIKDKGDTDKALILMCKAAN